MRMSEILVKHSSMTEFNFSTKLGQERVRDFVESMKAKGIIREGAKSNFNPPRQKKQLAIC